MSALMQPTPRARRAYVYLRPPSRAQVLDHPESTVLPYHLAQRAPDLDGPPDQIGVINDDFSPSAVSTHHRPGFQQLAAAVLWGPVGLALGIKVSRLARSCTDGPRFLELGALAAVAAVYDPNTNNDSLLPGLQGPLAAEFHLLRSRLLAACEPPAPRGDRGFSLLAGRIRPADDARVMDLLSRLCQQEVLQTLVALPPAHQEGAPASVEMPSPQPQKEETNS